MKDQYFGDFGDYQKISLLNKFSAKGLKILTFWMKTKDDGSSDGKHIMYLDNPTKWSRYEPEIFSYIKSKLKSSGRSLNHIEDSPFCVGVNFVSDYVENTATRTKLVNRICKDRAFDMVFFDPDNGIEVSSTSAKSIHKYVTWDEIMTVFSSGKSVLIYQHFGRVNRESFILNK